ncbi:hypothetical protein [Corynebacterium glutamicum]|uniref:hypothetical protein n=1 Tax=Corynebacterium glutamicum TaxID=1718 RepID=UPI000941CCA9|nr:hypothetical protein [Corynebacterium glutamicum]OKX88592.1 hypothetical protein AUO96_02975 [Corynebacterium glutamicum]QDX75806.1 hypothetical protein AKL15_08680 [Corynebacterium glutamicum]QDX78577.1 hypothetical protein AKL16_08680 [Corynebacterium glutamicum]TWS31923.1 hypothetical protein AKJ19_13235 [Corynebacterium glutamicum]TWS32875.1 hypothetical protein AKJ20_13210 [Corynebacterium glutamicum]
MKSHETYKVPKGLKPILLEGTDGHFDPSFELVKWSLDEAVEAWWSFAQSVDPRNVVPPVMTPQVGSPKTWLEGFQETSLQRTYVISETKNPQWCFSAPIEEPRIPGPLHNALRDGGVARRTEALQIKYFLDNEAPIVSFRHFDFRVGGQLRERWVQRFRGKFESSFYDDISYEFPGEPSFEGRGWKKFDHEKLYALCMEMGIDLQDPEFLTGRFVIIDGTVRPK